MTVAQQTPTEVPPAPPKAPPRNGRWTGFRYLLAARLLELKREPEVIFWVFGFPLLLAAGLGIAFRNKPPDVTPVAIVAGPGADQAVSLLQRSPRGSSIRETVATEAEALQGFRLENTTWSSYRTARTAFSIAMTPHVRKVYCPGQRWTMPCKAQRDEGIRCQPRQSPPLNRDRAISTS